MRIKIIGDNNCARATRHLLRVAGFAVTEFLPAEAVTQGPHAGYAITIDLAPGHVTPGHVAPGHVAPGHVAPADLAPAHLTPDSHLRPDSATHHQHASASEEAHGSHPGASLPTQAIHFDSVDSALEAAVLRHVTQLAAAPVIVDRPGGVVHSDRELRIIAPNTGDARADEAAAVAIEFGVLRGLLDLTRPGVTWASPGKSGLMLASPSKRHFSDGDGDEPAEVRDSDGRRNSGDAVGWKRWWPFGILLLAGALGSLRASHAAAPRVGFCSARLQAGTLDLTTCSPEGERYSGRRNVVARILTAAFLERASVGGVVESDRLKPVLLEAAQEQVATGQGFRITDGNNFFVVDPCKAQVKLFASINQTANAQLVAGTASKKIYVCSIHVVAAAATDVAVVEGTGTVCGTSTAGVSGFGGATAATGWNFAGNGGIALGNGDSSLGAESASGDNLCIFNSGSGQVSGGISYVVQ
jgi:hypothetical protein